MVRSLISINITEMRLFSQEQQSTNFSEQTSNRIIRIRRIYKEKPRHQKFRKMISPIKKIIASIEQNKQKQNQIYNKLKTNQDGEIERQKYSYIKIRSMLDQVHIVGKLNEFWLAFKSNQMINWIMKHKKPSYTNILNYLDIQQFIKDFVTSKGCAMDSQDQNNKQQFINRCLVA